MRRLSILTILCAAGWAVPLGGQAPPSVTLWRVAASSLATPPPLFEGATGAFWNPAAVGAPRDFAVGAHVVHTSATLGLSGLIAGGSLPLPGPLRLGALLGRVNIRDLVRTTTSPDNTGGSIPVYEQFAGATLAFSTGWLVAGAALHLHESRFDIDKTSGVTLDVGVRTHPFSRLVVAASTHLLPINLSKDEATEYLAGAQYTVWERRRENGPHLRAQLRYGVAYRSDGSWEHLMGLGAEMLERLSLDAAVASEPGVVERTWRPSLSLGLRFGGYTIALSHGLGTNDVGGTFRVGLDVEFRP